MGIFYNDSPETKKKERLEKQSDWTKFDFNHEDKMRLEEIEEEEEESGKRVTVNVMLVY